MYINTHIYRYIYISSNDPSTISSFSAGKKGLYQIFPPLQLQWDRLFVTTGSSSEYNNDDSAWWLCFLRNVAAETPATRDGDVGGLLLLRLGVFQTQKDAISTHNKKSTKLRKGGWERQGHWKTDAKKC